MTANMDMSATQGNISLLIFKPLMVRFSICWLRQAKASCWAGVRGWARGSRSISLFKRSLPISCTYV